jgi:hypothetical protein
MPMQAFPLRVEGDGDDGPPGVVKELAAEPAEQPVEESGPALGSQHDEIRVLPAGSVEDGVHGIGVGQHRSVADSGVAQGPAPRLVERLMEIVLPALEP